MVGLYCGSDPALTGLHGSGARAQSRQLRAGRPLAECRQAFAGLAGAALMWRAALYACADRCGAAVRPGAALVARRGASRAIAGASASASAIYRETRPPAAALGARGLGGRGARQRGAGAGARRRRIPELRTAADLHDRRGPRNAEGIARRVGAHRLAALRLSGRGAPLPRALPAAPCGLLVETEIWPNLLAPARRTACRCCSRTRACRRNRRAPTRAWPGLTRPAIASLALVCAQSERGRGAPARARRAPRRGHRQPEIRQRRPTRRSSAGGRDWRARLGAAGAAAGQHARGRGEDAARGAAGLGRKRCSCSSCPGIPVASTRLPSFAQSRRSRSRACRRRQIACISATRWARWISTTRRPMSRVIGGSFVPLGGQNLIEACAAGVPVVLGPSMFNFAEATRLAVAAGAARAGGDAAGGDPRGLRAAGRLHARARRWGRRAGRLCEAHRGATRRHLELCRETALRAPARG